ncbi:hypothetical protein [Pedobacter ureilyticus]|uniref:Uncharacterized protein n=1 Tax=Pedobacter ureilyticus TaxID=1393051 RepID=A0ABW9J5Y7_9SPHI|nr:hypothetical protein [Pedobacter helvus]
MAWRKYYRFKIPNYTEASAAQVQDDAKVRMMNIAGYCVERNLSISKIFICGFLSYLKYKTALSCIFNL